MLTTARRPFLRFFQALLRNISSIVPKFRVVLLADGHRGVSNLPSFQRFRGSEKLENRNTARSHPPLSFYSLLISLFRGDFHFITVLLFFSISYDRFNADSFTLGISFEKSLSFFISHNRETYREPMQKKQRIVLRSDSCEYRPRLGFNPEQNHFVSSSVMQVTDITYRAIVLSVIVRGNER